MSFWTEEREIRIWDYKWQWGNPQGNEKSWCLVTKGLLGHPDNLEHRDGSDQAGLARCLSATPISVMFCLSMVMIFPGTGLLSHIFWGCLEES